MGANGSIYNIGTTALLSYQRALATTSHNIANVQNPNYSRQRVDLKANIPMASGAGFIGTGIHAADTARMYDQFLTDIVREHTSANASYNTYYSYSSQVDNLLADTNAGLSPGVESFFNAVHDVATDPTSIPARSVMLAEGENLADRFHYLNSRVQELQSHVDSETETLVSEINAQAQSIAKLNADIVYQKGLGGGHAPNDLLDQRDAAVQELAQRIGVSTFEQDDGSLAVFIGNGQNLVLGATARPLALVGNTYDNAKLEVTYDGSSIPITKFMTGGKLGGLLNFRDQMLDPVRNELGRIAVSVVNTFNTQHKQGMDLNGNLGDDFFYDLADTSLSAVVGPRVLPDTLGNDPATDLSGSVAFTDVTSLRASDYRLDYTGGNFVVTRLSDSSVVGSFANSGAYPQTLDLSATDGFSITLDGTSVSEGDNFLIQPTRNGAADIGVRIKEPSEIAAAAPVRIDEAANAAGSLTNTGSGVLTLNKVANAAGNTLTAAAGASAITLTYNSATLGYDVTAPASLAGVFIPYDPATQNGTQATLTLDTATYPGLTADFGDITFTLSGNPANGDAFVINDNNNGAGSIGVGDASNAKLLASLQTDKTMLISGGTSDYQGAYGQLVADVGIKTHQADVNRQAQDSLLQKATEERDAVSGVNLDEEAANLIKYQQAYQAAAQVFSVAQQIFQTLLSTTGR